MLSDYIVTPQVRVILRRIVDGLVGLTPERAWTLTGPYGTGKSTFALFLARLLSDPDHGESIAWRLLRQVDSSLAESLLGQLRGRRLLPVLLTARRVQLSTCLSDAIRSAADALAELAPNTTMPIRGDLRGDDSQDEADGRRVIDRLDALSDGARAVGFDGLILIVDELGKILEFVARNPEQGDIFLLQELAEYANRSEVPLLFLGVLHQAFEQYTQHLDIGMRREWAKVQGRFADIAFLEPPEQLMRLVAEAASGASESPLSMAANTESVIATATTPDFGLVPRGIGMEEFTELAWRARPLHPALLIALPYLFRRFAQNERSLFTYLLSQEPFGLQDHLRRCGADWVRLPDLFDYVMANMAAGMHRQTIHQRWLEVVDSLEETPDLSHLQIDIIKTVGVLGVLVDGSHLRPSAALISFALRDRPDSGDVLEALGALSERSLLVYRRFNDSYRVWEGSDVDVEARIDEGRRKTAGQFALASALQRYLHYRPLVAQRHSYEQGALRYFDVAYLDQPPAVENIPTRTGADGVIACCLPATSAAVDTFRQWAESGEPSGRANMLVAVPTQISFLHEATAELVALHWVRNNTPSLRDDRVARRELDQRLAEVEGSISQVIDRLLDPRPAPAGSGCAWYARGQRAPVRSMRTVSELLSATMDVLYPSSPQIWNELINRRTLSSAAAAARRTLVECMLTDGDQERLGIEGFRPERAMYESVLRGTGLHCEGSSGWRFCAPSESGDPKRLDPVWSEIARLVFAAVDEPLSVQELFDHLSAPPYGVMTGVLPVLLCTFLQVHRNEVSLYRERTFLPEPGIADFEILMRRPELFAIGGVRVVGERQAVVDRLARGLGVEPSLLPVVRALLRMMTSLPDHTRRTRRLPVEAIQLREAFDKARSPERLLFQDLPVAVGEMPFTEADPLPGRVDRFFDRLNQALQELDAVYARHIAQARDTLLAACDLPDGAAGWEQLRALARRLAPVVRTPAVQPFLDRLTKDEDDATALQSVLALVTSGPPGRGRTLNSVSEGDGGDSRPSQNHSLTLPLTS